MDLDNATAVHKGITITPNTPDAIDPMQSVLSFFRKSLSDGGKRYGNEKQDTSSVAAIIAQSKTFQCKNLVTGAAFGLTFSFNRPSTYKYSASQWLWGTLKGPLMLDGSRC